MSSKPTFVQSTNMSATRPTLTKEAKQALDEKYTQPLNFKSFKIYFGKHKGSTYADVALDKDYVDYLMKLPPSTNGLYLFQRYIQACRDESN